VIRILDVVFTYPSKCSHIKPPLFDYEAFTPFLPLSADHWQYQTNKAEFLPRQYHSSSNLLSSRKRLQQAYQSMFPGTNLPSLPCFTSLPSFSTNFLARPPGSNKREVCHLDNSNTVLVYNIAADRLFFYTQTELVSLSFFFPNTIPCPFSQAENVFARLTRVQDLIRLSKSVYPILVPKFSKKVDIWLPAELEDLRDAGGDGGRESMESGDWVYVREHPGDEWIGRDAGEARCRTSQGGIREWWRGRILLPSQIRFERLMRRWAEVLVVEE
jgi:hypothetical protein